MAISEDANPNDLTARGGSRNLLLLVILAVAVLGMGVGGWVVYTRYIRPCGREAAAAQPHAPAPQEQPTLVSLEPFLVNLADASGKRYLRTTFEIEVSSVPTAEEMKKKIPRIRDGVLLVLTSKSFEDIRLATGKAQLRDDIVGELNKIFTAGTARTVYFKEFVVQ